MAYFIYVNIGKGINHCNWNTLFKGLSHRNNNRL